MLRVDRALLPRGDRTGARGFDELEAKTVWIAEGEDSFAKPFAPLSDRDAELQQPRPPICAGSRRNRERDGRHLTRANRPLSRLRPGKEREDRSRCAVLVAKIEVIRFGIVEVDGELHQAKGEGGRIEVEIPLRIAGDGGDVMNA